MVLKAKILIAEDEIAQQELLRYNLEAEGYDLTIADNGEDAVLLFEEEEPDLVILDWMMPRQSGIEACRQIRSLPKGREIPIIMLSARGAEEDMVRGLEIGADDYLAKPYSVRELVARLKSQLRRSQPATTGAILSHGDIEVDTTAHRVFRNGSEVSLGPLEFKLLCTFLSRPGRVWDRDQLLDRVWGREVMIDTRTVDVHVGRLRKSLCRTITEDPIRTVRGAGYALG